MLEERSNVRCSELYINLTCGVKKAQKEACLWPRIYIRHIIQPSSSAFAGNNRRACGKFARYTLPIEEVREFPAFHRRNEAAEKPTIRRIRRRRFPSENTQFPFDPTIRDRSPQSDGESCRALDLFRIYEPPRNSRRDSRAFENLSRSRERSLWYLSRRVQFPRIFIYRNFYNAVNRDDKVAIYNRGTAEHDAKSIGCWASAAVVDDMDSSSVWMK